jgi:hypothetical protein
MESNNIKAYVALFLIIIIVFVINIISFKNGHNWGDDFADYINFAKGIVNGTLDELVSISTYRVDNSTVPTGSANTYWGVYYIFGFDIHIFKIYVYLFFICSLIIISLLFNDRLNSLQNLLLVAIIGFNPYFFNFKDNILTDFPYFFFSLLSLLLIKRYFILKNNRINRYYGYFLLGFLIFLSTLLRPVGIILLPTLLFVLYIENRPSLKSFKHFFIKDKFKFIPFIVFITLSVITSVALPKASISVDSDILLNSDISNIIFNLKYHLFAPAHYLPYFDVRYNAYGLGYDKIHLVLYTIIMLAVVYGITRNLKGDYLFLIYMLLNLMLFIIVRGRDHRFFMPLFPFFIYFLLSGMSFISLSFSFPDKYNNARVNAAYFIGVGLLMTSLLYVSNGTYENITFNQTQIIEGPHSPDSIELFSYIKEHTGEDDSIIFHKSRAMLLYTDRRSFSMGSQNFTPDKAFNSDADYIVISKKKYLPHDLTLQDFQGKLECEFENTSFLLCDLKKS